MYSPSLFIYREANDMHEEVPGARYVREAQWVISEGLHSTLRERVCQWNNHRPGKERGGKVFIRTV
jgi:hypothetical protein